MVHCGVVSLIATVNVEMVKKHCAGAQLEKECFQKTKEQVLLKVIYDVNKWT